MTPPSSKSHGVAASPSGSSAAAAPPPRRGGYPVPRRGGAPIPRRRSSPLLQHPPVPPRLLRALSRCEEQRSCSSNRSFCSASSAASGRQLLHPHPTAAVALH
ncbi:hypothetical protein U9M48_017907 [Paspalum notatum var. saurae]|uniref:Uncharacterized protein n=1 Tax=Paspalum notatum var. saurae TaxID=547442 RepID=A0AAQ3WPC5_PASNO